MSDITIHAERVRDMLGHDYDDVIRAHIEQAVEEAIAYVEAGGMGWSIEARAIASIRHAYRPELYAHPDAR